MGIEPIVRPFTTDDVSPVEYVQPGTVGVPPAIVKIGMRGGTTIFNGSFSFQATMRLGAVHKEGSPTSQTIQETIANGG